MTPADLEALPLFSVRREMTRRKSNRDELREILSDGKAHTNVELTERAGFRFGARVLEMRRGDTTHPPVVIHRYSGEGGVWLFKASPDGSFDPGCDSCPRCRGGA
jgi:hypothetical protein